jgi:hypothetical protein
MGIVALVLAAQECTPVVAGHLAVGDGEVLHGAREPQGMRGFDDDGIVVGRVDAAIGNMHVAAGIDVDAVAVGIDLQIVDGDVEDAGRQNAVVSGY